MRHVPSLLASFGLLALASGCSGVKQVPTVGVSNSQQAALLATGTSNKLKLAPGDATPASGLGLGAGSLTLTYNCPTSGSFSLTLSANGAGSSASIDETIAFHDCVKVNDYEFDGTIVYAFTFSNSGNGSSFATSLDGSLAVVLHDSNGVVTQSANVTYDKLTWTVTEATTSSGGKTCETVTASSSGSMLVGGSAVNPSNSDFATAWGTLNGTASVCTP